MSLAAGASCLVAIEPPIEHTPDAGTTPVEASAPDAAPEVTTTTIAFIGGHDGKTALDELVEADLGPDGMPGTWRTTKMPDTLRTASAAVAW